ncbi:MAG: transglutaminase family protein [Polyangiales bacterium]
MTSRTPDASPDSAFLASSEWIDSDHPDVRRKAAELAEGAVDPVEVARRCFVFVRDRIAHSWDARSPVVTCRASDVLREGTGYCYAKSHLLTALLRANGLPAGLCYQRLTIDVGPPYCLHGLVGVHLPDHGWYRVDARGNKPGVDARFDPPEERLAFHLVDPGERDYPGIHAEPWPEVVEVLTSETTVQGVFEHLPDVGEGGRPAASVVAFPSPPDFC